ncbi:DUF6210 family protein [Lentzea sp. NPDC004782]|uniref:DUF6210 family protein n=1 Tax=Lentzea sp. NPDC004782 TaxID=3154458 RepID=UPI0033B84A66
MRYVDLDPFETGGWLAVVVRAKTGVTYRQQYGGTACRQGEVEGYLVPLHAPELLDELVELFDVKRAGTRNDSWRHRLSKAVGGVWFGGSEGEGELRLGEIGEVDEAWVPVVTPDGPAVLMWCNSD